MQIDSRLTLLQSYMAYQANPTTQGPSQRSSLVAASEQVSLSFTVKIGQQVLYGSLTEKLEIGQAKFTQNAKATDEADSSSRVTADNPLGFDYERLAKKVMTFVSQRIHKEKSNGATDDKLKTLLGQARLGIDMGFTGARNELGNMGWLSDGMEKGINKGYELIQTEFDKFEKDLFGQQSEDKNTDDKNTASVSTASQANDSLMAAQTQTTVSLSTAA